jgi:MFS family permease
LIVQYVPSPTTVVFAVLAAAFALLVALVVGLPETIQRRPGALAALLPRLGVPRAARTQFVIATPILMATWAMGGLYLSLGASLTAGVFGIHSHVVAGLAVTVLAAAGALAGVWGSDRDAARVMTAGAFLLIAGNAVTLLALFTTSTPVFFAGAAVSGLGFGSGFLGAFRSLVALAEPGERAGLFGAIYTVSYIGFSVLAVIAGLLTPEFGLKQTAIGYGITVIVLTLAAVLPRVIRSRSGQLEIEELAEEIDAAERPTLATACPTAVATTE